MKCTQIQTLLDAYADSELNLLQAWGVRRHLAACPACAAQLAGIQRLRASVHAWRDVSAPAALQGRIAAALPRTAAADPTPHNRRVARRAAVGLVGVAAAIGAGLWLLPGHPSQPTLAFADVKQAMEQVETLSWVTTAHNNFLDQTGHKFETDAVERTWLRRKPAAIATLEIAKGHSEGLKGLTDSRGKIFQYADNAYRVYKPDANEDIEEMVVAKVRRMTQLPTQNAALNLNATVRRRLLPLQEHETLLDGHVQTLFVRKGDLIVTTNPAPLRLIHVSESIWVEPTTRRITRIDIENSGGEKGPNSQASIIYSNFQYDQTPPPGVFDWSPPPGATVTRF